MSYISTLSWLYSTHKLRREEISSICNPNDKRHFHYFIKIILFDNLLKKNKKNV